MTSEKMILDRLRPQYASLFQAMGMSQVEATQAFESLITKAKQESKRKQTSDWDASRLFAVAETSEGIRSELDWKRQEGVREVDLQWWWNLPDLERQMLLQSDEISRVGYYEALRTSGKSKEESFLELRLAHPWFIEFVGWFEGVHDVHMPLPVELKARVLEFQERQNASEVSRIAWRERRMEAGSANAAIRDQIRHGSL